MIDRRHIVLAIAAAASVGHTGKDAPNLFEGLESLDVGPLWLKEYATRTWMVTIEFKAPAEFASSPYRSDMWFSVGVSDGDAPVDVSFATRECDGEHVIDVESPPPNAQLQGIDLSGCMSGAACAYSVCLDAENHERTPAEIRFDVLAEIWSEEEGERGVPPIEVPIEITVEEIEP